MSNRIVTPALLQVSLWRLADDEEAYGDHAGWFILTSPDGETEMEGGPWTTEDEATIFAANQGWTVVPSSFHETHAATSNRPGDQAAIYAEETGISYEAALVACNMD